MKHRRPVSFVALVSLVLPLALVPLVPHVSFAALPSLGDHVGFGDAPRVLRSQSLSVCSGVLGSRFLAVFFMGSWVPIPDSFFFCFHYLLIDRTRPRTRAPSSLVPIGTISSVVFATFSLSVLTSSKSFAVAFFRQQHSNFVNRSVARFYFARLSSSTRHCLSRIDLHTTTHNRTKKT